VSVIIAPAVSPLGTSAHTSRDEHAVSAVDDDEDACARHLIDAFGAVLDRTRALGAGRATCPMARYAGDVATEAMTDHALLAVRQSRGAPGGLKSKAATCESELQRVSKISKEGFGNFHFDPEP
jgi:hypothetical protein